MEVCQMRGEGRGEKKTDSHGKREAYQIGLVHCQIF